VVNNSSTDWEAENLLGKVKSSSSFKYFADSEAQGIAKAILESKSVYQFNEHGFTTRETISDILDNVIRESTYNYDKTNKRINKITLDKRNNKEITVNYLYEGPTRTSALLFEPNVSVPNFILFEYDDKGNKLAEKYHRGSDSVNYTSIRYLYDEQNRNIQRNSFNSAGDLIETFLFDYDKRNNIKSLKRINSEGEVTQFYYTYEKFDDKGNWILKYDYIGETARPFMITDRIVEYHD
jgi:nuclear transport factor 2 (NTF2) superfamily protein